jgi:hypothetical protein
VPDAFYAKRIVDSPFPRETPQIFRKPAGALGRGAT